MTGLIEYGIHTLVAPQLARQDAALLQRILWRDGWPLHNDSLACMLEKGAQLDLFTAGYWTHGQAIRDIPRQDTVHY